MSPFEIIIPVSDLKLNSCHGFVEEIVLEGRLSADAGEAAVKTALRTRLPLGPHDIVLTARVQQFYSKLVDIDRFEAIDPVVSVR